LNKKQPDKSGQMRTNADKCGQMRTQNWVFVNGVVSVANFMNINHKNFQLWQKLKKESLVDSQEKWEL